MIKWILGILALIVLLVAVAFSTFVWLVMAKGLQEMVEDNLTLLRRDLIMEDRPVSYDYENYGVEVKGFLDPAVTLINPRVIVKSGSYEYRLTAPELSFIGSFSRLDEVVLQAPSEIQLTIKQESLPPRILTLELPSHLRLSLIAEAGESHLWNRYQLKQNLSGKVGVKDEKTGVKAAVKYSLLRTEPRKLGAPYSPYLLPVLRKFSAAAKLP